MPAITQARLDRIANRLKEKIAQRQRDEDSILARVDNLGDEQLLAHLVALYRVAVMLDLTPDEREFFATARQTLLEAGVNPADLNPLFPNHQESE